MPASDQAPLLPRSISLSALWRTVIVVATLLVDPELFTTPTLFTARTAGVHPVAVFPLPCVAGHGGGGGRGEVDGLEGVRELARRRWGRNLARCCCRHADGALCWLWNDRRGEGGVAGRMRGRLMNTAKAEF